MRSILLFVLAPIIVVVGGFGLFLLSDNTALLQDNPECGLTVAGELAAPSIDKGAKWSVISYDGTDTVPSIRLRELAPDAIKAPDPAARGCELEIRDFPAPDTAGVDWRIGRTVDAKDLRGKTVLVRFSVRASEAGTLPQGTVYVYDGKRVAGLSVHEVGPEWVEHDIVYSVPADADRLELWFRLFLDRPEADPERNRLFFTVALLPPPPGETLSEQSGTPARPDDPACGLLVADGLAAGSIDAGRKWSISAYDGTGALPKIDVKALAPEALGAPDDRAQGCEIDIGSPLVADTSGADWRIGRTIDAKGLRGQTVIVRFTIRAQEAASLPQGTVYVYDGRTVAGIPVHQVGTDWVDHDISYAVPADADLLEIWFRLFLDRPEAEPALNRLYVAASLLSPPAGPVESTK